MESPNQRLERILVENNLTLAQNPLTTATISDGNIIVKAPVYYAAFIDPAKEADGATPKEASTETNG